MRAGSERAGARQPGVEREHVGARPFRPDNEATPIRCRPGNTGRRKISSVGATPAEPQTSMGRASVMYGDPMPKYRSCKRVVTGEYFAKPADPAGVAGGPGGRSIRSGFFLLCDCAAPVGCGPNSTSCFEVAPPRRNTHESACRRRGAGGWRCISRSPHTATRAPPYVSPALVLIIAAKTPGRHRPGCRTSVRGARP